MKLKAFLAAAACALLAMLETQSAHGSTTATGTVTVKWQTQAINTVKLVTNYSVAAGIASQGNGAVTFFTGSSPAGGTGSCGANANEANATNNFGNVTPDSTTHYTDCLYKNGIDAHVFTTDGLGYSLSTAGTLPKSCGAVDCAGGPYILCLFPNAAYANNVGAPNATASSASAAIAVDNGGTNTCGHGGGGTIATEAGSGTTILASQPNPTGANGADFSSDLELAIPPFAQTLNESLIVTYTLTPN